MGKALLYSWKKQGKSEDLPPYFPMHWKMCEHLCGMRCICNLTPSLFPPQHPVAPIGISGSSQQWGPISAQHSRSEAQSQPSPVPQQQQRTAQRWYYLIAAPNGTSALWFLVYQVMLILGHIHLLQQLCCQRTSSRSCQRFLLLTFWVWVALLPLTATCFWRASKITIASKLKLTVKGKIADNF